jgi:hypothetical protein
MRQWIDLAPNMIVREPMRLHAAVCPAESIMPFRPKLHFLLLPVSITSPSATWVVPRRFPQADGALASAVPP